MGFVDLARERFSVRAFEDRPVEDEKLMAVLEAARLAPSAANRQPLRFIVAHTAGREEALRRVYDREWFVGAPIVICACVVPGESWVRVDGRSYADFDAAVAVDHLMLAAADLGLGTCWVAAFDVGRAREAFGIPPDVEPVAFTPLGYPAASPPKKERKPLDVLVRYEHW
jgi:nitroreductase